LWVSNNAIGRSCRPYGQRLKPAQTNLEVANATPPVRVNQRSASQRSAQTFLRGGVEQSQSGNEIKTFQAAGVARIFAPQTPLTCYSINNSSKPGAYCHKVCKGGSSVTTAQVPWLPEPSPRLDYDTPHHKRRRYKRASPNSGYKSPTLLGYLLAPCSRTSQGKRKQ